MAMKTNACLGLALLLFPLAGRSGPPAPQTTAVPQQAEMLLVGILTRQYTPGCDNGQDVWREPSHFEIGFVRVVLPAHINPGPLLGKVVVARGTVVDEKVPPYHIFDNGGLCSVQQMRSDWVVSKEGIRLYSERGGALARMGVLAAATLRTADAPTVLPGRGPGDPLTVRFRNPLDLSLTDLRIEGHYEGCFGKPGASSETATVAALAPGAIAEVRLPRLLSEKDPGYKRAYRLHSLRLRTATPGVAFDMDAPVARTLSDCPER